MVKFFIYLFVFAGIWQNAVAQDFTIDSLRIKAHIQYLASDELNGRFSGTEGEKKAAEYIRSQLRSVGCELLYNNGFQEFTIDGNLDGKPMPIGINVVGLIEGTKKSDEYIVVGAHYDHLGMGGRLSRKPDTTALHPGADDNASGVAVLIELAKAFAEKKPERSVIFAAFSGEELGLVGSKYFVEHTPVNFKQIKAMVNFDMVGHLDSILNIHGTQTALQFDSLLFETNSELFRIERFTDGFGPSDHTSFYAEKIPVLFFHTTIGEDYYHTPFDVWETVNNRGAANVANYAAQIILKLTSQQQSITYQSVGDLPQKPRMSMKVSLGIMPDHNSKNGLKISSVRPNSTAEKSGLLKNDIIKEINGLTIQDIYSYMEAMQTLEKGQTTSLSILRNDKTVTLKISF